MSFIRVQKKIGSFLSANLLLLLLFIFLTVSSCSKTELQTPETKIEVIESNDANIQARLSRPCNPAAASDPQALVTSLNNYSICEEKGTINTVYHWPGCFGVTQGITMPFSLKHPVSDISFPLSRSAVRSFYDTVIDTYSSDISTLYDAYCGGVSSRHILEFEFINTTSDIFCEPHITVNYILYTCCY